MDGSDGGTDVLDEGVGSGEGELNVGLESMGGTGVSLGGRGSSTVPSLGRSSGKDAEGWSGIAATGLDMA